MGGGEREGGRENGEEPAEIYVQVKRETNKSSCCAPACQILLGKIPRLRSLSSASAQREARSRAFFLMLREDGTQMSLSYRLNYNAASSLPPLLAISLEEIKKKTNLSTRERSIRLPNVNYFSIIFSLPRPAIVSPPPSARYFSFLSVNNYHRRLKYRNILR